MPTVEAAPTGDGDSEDQTPRDLDASDDPDAMVPAHDADASSPDEGALEPSACPDQLLGFATLQGDGVDGTTGGGSAKPVRPTSVAQLLELSADDVPRVIEIAGTVSVPRLQLGSNKTLVGVDAQATLEGGLRIRGRKDAPVHNVIVKNLRVNGASSEVDGDAVQLYFAHHVWIDHVEIWDGPDGNLDMTHAVNWVTVSFSKFRYSEDYRRPQGESADHRFSSLLGHSDGNSQEDQGRLKVTFHHNFWAEGVIERMPRVRFGQVHVYNNYFAAPGNNYCVRAGTYAQLLIEHNVFEGVKNPHEFNSASDQKTANITARGNLYDNTSGKRDSGGGGVAFGKAPYAAMYDVAENVAQRVRACAGPR